MKKTFIISTAGGRLDGFCNVVRSISNYFNTGWDMCICFQKYADDELEQAISFLDETCPGKYTYITMNELTGCHLARVAMLDQLKSDVYCLIDDDMEMYEGLTKYDDMAEFVVNFKEIGLLSGNWRRSEKQVKSTEPISKVLMQKIVYTGGGMVFRDDVADVIRNIPRKMYLFDNPLWSIYVYVNGYDNARYMGSICVHKVCSKGGRRRWIKEVDDKKHLPPAEWIGVEKGANPKPGGFDEYLMCGEKNITALAKKLHKENKK